MSSRIAAENVTRAAQPVQGQGGGSPLQSAPKRRDLRSKRLSDKKEEQHGHKLVAKGYEPLRYGDTITIQTGGVLPLRIVGDGVLTCTAGLLPRSTWNTSEFEQEQLFMLLPTGPTSCRERLRACIKEMRERRGGQSEVDEVALTVLHASVDEELANVHSSQERRWRKAIRELEREGGREGGREGRREGGRKGGRGGGAREQDKKLGGDMGES